MNNIVETLKKVSTAMVSDALTTLGIDRGVNGGVMRSRIRQIVPGTKIVGPAFTVRTPPGNNLPCLKALEKVRKGEVIVIDAGGDEKYCYLGEIMATDAINAGAVGIVIDGLVRDVGGMIRLELPVFAKGTTPRAALYWNLPGKTGVSITCGGCVVEPGDIIHGDGDGVAVILGKDTQRVAELAQKFQSSDDEHFRMVRSGKRLSEFPGVYEPHTTEGY